MEDDGEEGVGVSEATLEALLYGDEAGELDSDKLDESDQEDEAEGEAIDVHLGGVDVDGSGGEAPVPVAAASGGVGAISGGVSADSGSAARTRMLTFLK